MGHTILAHMILIFNRYVTLALSRQPYSIHSLVLSAFVSLCREREMESIGVLMMCPMNSYLENELQKRYNLHRFWTCPEKSVFLETHRSSIRAIVGNASVGADAKLIDDLPKLEIISSFSVGVDKIDLGKCKEKGIRVTNTPDVLTEDVADLAIGLILALLRRLCECDRYVRSGKWKYGDFQLTTKVSLSLSTLQFLPRVGVRGLVWNYSDFRFSGLEI